MIFALLFLLSVIPCAIYLLIIYTETSLSLKLIHFLPIGLLNLPNQATTRTGFLCITEKALMS